MPPGTSLTACAGTSGSHSQWVAGGRRDRTAIVAARPYLACSEYGHGQGVHAVELAPSGKRLVTERRALPARPGSRDAGYAVRSGFGVPSLGSSGGTELGVLRCWLARRWEDNQCVVADATLPSVMLDWVTRAIRLASSGSMRLGTCGRRQASWDTGKLPGHLWNPPNGIACFFTLPWGM